MFRVPYNRLRKGVVLLTVLGYIILFTYIIHIKSSNHHDTRKKSIDMDHNDIRDIRRDVIHKSSDTVDMDHNDISDVQRDVLHMSSDTVKPAHKASDKHKDKPNDEAYDPHIFPYDNNPWNNVKPADDLLKTPDGHLTPTYVYYVWCRKRWFEFQYYLSIRSAIKYLNADRIILYYSNIPKRDDAGYNQWYDEIRKEYPWITPIRLKDSEMGACQDRTSMRSFAMQKLSKTGGVFMSENTILTKPLNDIRVYSLVEALQNGYGFMMINKHPKIIETKQIKCTILDFQGNATIPEEKYSIDSSADKGYCIIMPNKATWVYPKDIWGLDNAFGRAARDIYYGHESKVETRHSLDNLVPNIAHMILLGGHEMQYLCYLGILSLLHIVKIDRLYIHGEVEPKGYLWEIVKKERRVEYVFLDYPKAIYLTEGKFLPQHISDMIRVDLMIKYGGLYMDTDAIFVKPLDDHIRGYDVVATFDWATGWVPPWPDIINFGITLGKRGAPYWHLFQQSMHDWWELNWSYNGLQQPYKVYERHPHMVHIDPHWQIICFGYEYGCHPTWIEWPKYFDRNITHRQTGMDWTKDAYAFHWTDPTPPALESEKNLIKANDDDIFAQIGRYVLEKSGLLEEAKKKYKR